METTLSYLAPMADKPRYYLYPPPDGQPWRNTRGDRRAVTVHDARALAPEASLEREGFALAPLRSAVADPYDAEAVRKLYYREVEELVAKTCGASRVLAFDHNVRNEVGGGRERAGISGPVRFVHNDYTEASGPQRVRDLLPPDEARERLARRFAVVNVWKPIRGPVQRAPLAVCAAGGLAPADLVPTDLCYADRTGEVYSITWSPAHRWYYYSEQQADEALLLKCFDSEAGTARFTAHTAFDPAEAPEGAAPRESIEVRTLAFF